MPEHEIIAIARRVEIDNTGAVVDVQQVKFRTAKGVIDSVRLPVSLSPEEVRELVRAAAGRLDSIMGPV